MLSNQFFYPSHNLIISAFKLPLNHHILLENDLELPIPKNTLFKEDDKDLDHDDPNAD